MRWWRLGGTRQHAVNVGLVVLASAACLAVSAPGLATAADSQGWSASKLPLPAGAAPNSFRPLALSCSSATQCAGGAGYTATPLNSPAALLALSGKKWTDTQAPLPAGAIAATQQATVASVACPAATTCFAGGHYRDASGNQAMLLSWSGKTWTAAIAPLPAGANSNPDAVVSGISCPSPTWCTAVGQYDASPDQYGLILRRSDGKWTATAAPVPTGAQALGALNAVSCPAASRCFAGGWDYADDGSSPQLLLLTWWQGKWSDVDVPLPKGAAANAGAAIDAIACPTVTECVAAGSYDNSAGDQEGVLLAWSGKKWTATTAPLPRNAGANPWTSLNTVACPVSSRCVAGGEYENSASQPLGLLLTWSQGSWTAAEAPTAGYDVHAISCPSATRCFALSAGIYSQVLLTGP